MKRTEPRIGNHSGVRSGVFYFLLILILIRGLLWGASLLGYRNATGIGIAADSLWQSGLDSIGKPYAKSGGWTLRPLDPNHLEDYRGYLLGIPHTALDSLYAYRSRGGLLYSMEQFRRISGLSAGKCQELQPFFRFPDPGAHKVREKGEKTYTGNDLNKATAGELQVVPGIGPVLSRRIVRFREALGGFLHPSQLYDVYGLDPEVARRVMEAFPLASKPRIHRLDLNQASVEDLASLLYITWEMAADIVARRDSMGPYENLEELHGIRSLPKDKIDRIALYLGL